MFFENIRVSKYAFITQLIMNEWYTNKLNPHITSECISLLHLLIKKNIYLEGLADTSLMNILSL